ncbi:MAG TPA: DUF488 domain-containing protein [Mariniphaga sp.]|nr:DUF488 domain-containing protein [Mariniphaga sp.]
MYYRRKILLSLLQTFNEAIDKVSFQHLLFLLSTMQKEKLFHFIPSKVGCFSFQAEADLKTLTKYKQVESSGNYWKKTDNYDYVDELSAQDKAALKTLKEQYGSFEKDELIAYTHRQYPYLAINSTMAESLSTAEENEMIKNLMTSHETSVLFTIGYEGITLEEYLNKLIDSDVKVLCDVRKNPMSMKFGFNKKQLQTACNEVNIEYIHIPEVGIDANIRKEFSNQTDHQELLEIYKSNILPTVTHKQKEILLLVKNKKRIALTCYEADLNQCHRKPLAESISKLPDFNFELKHL